MEKDERLEPAIDSPPLEERTLDWIEEESRLLCELAVLDATFDSCDTQLGRQRRLNGRRKEDAFLYADFLDVRGETSNSAKSILLRARKEEEHETSKELVPGRKGWTKNGMIAILIFSIALSVIVENVDIFDASPNLSSSECSKTGDLNFVGSSWNYVRDADEADPFFFRGDQFMMIFVYNKMAIRSRRWIEIMKKMERFLRNNNKNFDVRSCQCFQNDKFCEALFGIEEKAPAVVVKTKGRYYHFGGRLSIDHVWAWSERLMTPVEFVYDLEDYYKKFMNYDVTFTAYLPFSKNGSLTHIDPHFSGYERVALARMTGTPDSHRTRFFVVLNQTLAEYLKIDTPGTVLFQAILGRYEYLDSGWKELDLLSYVLHWERTAFRVPFIYKGLHPLNKYKLQSNRYFTKITNGTTVVLFTRHDALYYPGNEESTIFREIALEYSDCDTRPVWQWRAPKKIFHPRRYTAAMDAVHSERRLAIAEDERIAGERRIANMMNACCGDIAGQLSIDALCSCCQPSAATTGERWRCDLASCSRRNVANLSSVYEMASCQMVIEERNRDEILSACCEIVHDSTRPGRSDHEERKRVAMAQEDALRAFLHQGNVETEVSRAGADVSRNMTLWKYGCMVDEPLRFVIVDMKRTPTLARRLGVDPRGPSRVAVIDAAEERAALMEWQYSRQSLRHFIASFYTEEIEWAPQHQMQMGQHRRRDRDAAGEEMGEEREGVLRMIELDYDQFVALTTKTTLDRDAVLFLTGGVSHAASAVLHFQVYETMHFFRQRNIPIDFYSYDVTVYDVPYNFKMGRFPSLHFLPADRPLNSLEYPKSLQFTSSNLVYFALVALSDNVRWLAVLNDDSSANLIARHLRTRINEMERELQRSRHSSDGVIRITSKVRASRELLNYLHERRGRSHHP